MSEMHYKPMENETKFENGDIGVLVRSLDHSLKAWNEKNNRFPC